MSKQRNRTSGFTLVELAIVLVIIGLLVGGVLVGQDLIKAATVRSAVSQLGTYDAGANTFRSKYGGLPGDLANAVDFFSTVTGGGANGQGDGDGLVESVSAAATPCNTITCLAGEAAVFWFMMTQSGYIPEGMASNTYTAYTVTPSDTVLPQSKLGRGSRVAVTAVNGRNYYVIGNPGTAAAVAGAVTWTAGTTPIDAYGVDDKMDDGFPGTGRVLSVAIAAPNAAVAANGAATGAVAATTCYDSTRNVYLTTLVNAQTNTDLVVCNMGIRTSF